MSSLKHIAKLTVRSLLGLNGAAVIRTVRLGPRELQDSCRRAYDAVWPMEGASITGIPTVPLEHILGGTYPSIRIDTRPYEDGTLPTEDAMALLSLLAAEHPQAVLEIGTFMGRTTKWMAWNLERGIVHTVDLPENFNPEEEKDSPLPKDDFHLIAQRRVGCDYRNDPVSSRIVQHFADTASWDFAEAGEASFFFIDGSHTYEYCRNDSEKCLACCLNHPATFVWHDCDRVHPGVVRLLLEWRAQGRNIGRIAGTRIAYWKKTA